MSSMVFFQNETRQKLDESPSYEYVPVLLRIIHDGIINLSRISHTITQFQVVDNVFKRCSCDKFMTDFQKIFKFESTQIRRN